METEKVWRQLFNNWPKEVARRGVAVTAFGEQIPFENFLVQDHFLFAERRAPDTLGARQVIIPFTQLVAVKITDVVKAKAFKELGFHEPQPERDAT